MGKSIKIVNIGDIHIRLFKMHNIHREQFKKFYNQLDEVKPERIIITGDVVHSKIQISPEMVGLVSEFLVECAKRAKLVIIPGNHDAVVSSDRLDALTPIINTINSPNITYFTKSGVYQDTEYDNLVYCVWSCLEDQKTPEIAEWQEKNDPELKKQYIALYHGVLNGAVTDTGYKFEFNLSSNDFYRTDIAMLSDIHLHQALPYSNFRGNFTQAVYSSSFIQNNFGESEENHGYVLWTFEDGEWDHEMIDIPSDYGFFTLNIDAETLSSIIDGATE